VEQITVVHTLVEHTIRKLPVYPQILIKNKLECLSPEVFLTLSKINKDYQSKAP